jgi:N-acetyl-gamma-glutamyl-phosphate reductase
MNVGLLGVTGYTGEELVMLLERNASIHLSFATSEHQAGSSLGTLYPTLSRFHDVPILAAREAADIPVDLVFLCLPAGESAVRAQPFIEKKSRVIDLGADFRFRSPSVYEQWYKQPHPYPDCLQQTVYGLPEWNREQIKDALIVGNPGCYPTSVLLALLPLLKAGVVNDTPLLVDSKSGISGAGKKPTTTTHFIQAHDNVCAYKAGRIHRHVGEIEDQCKELTHSQLKTVFTPHLVPMGRGIFSNILVQTNSDIHSRNVDQILRDTYANEPFIKILDHIPSTRQVERSNFCFIHGQRIQDTDYIQLFSAIDNLGKGASWQAVQNMNIMFGWEETTGLWT